jgi:hypothetical protein
MFRKNEMLAFNYFGKPRIVRIIKSRVGPNGRYVNGRDFGTDPSGPIKSFLVRGGKGKIKYIPEIA